MSREKVRIIHLADSHIDPTFRYLGAKQYERRRDFLQAFLYAVKKTLELKPDMLIISGDLYDKVNPRNPARTKIMRALRRISHEGIEIYAISGNHDTPRSIEEGASPLHEIEASGFIKYFSKTSEMEAYHIKVGSLDICISGASFNHTFPEELDPLEVMTPPTEGDINIAILHYNFTPVKIKPIWIAPTIRETSIPKNLHYLALGHIHNFQKIRIGDTWIIYPGSTERRSFAEEDEPKGFVYLELSTDGMQKIEYIQTNPRPLKTIELNLKRRENPVEKVVKVAMKHANPKTILRLKIKGQLPLEELVKYNREEILRNLEQKFFHIIIDDRELEYLFEEIEIESIETLDPIKLYENYLINLIKKAEEEGAQIAKSLRQAALELGRKLLEEVE